MASNGNGKRKPDGNAEISVQTGRTTNRKTKPPARRITIITTTATTKIRTKTKNPIRVITDQPPKTRNGRTRIWGRNLVRMENLPRPSDLVDSPISVSSAVELDIQQRIFPKLQRLKEEPHRSRRPTANPPRTRKNR